MRDGKREQRYIGFLVGMIVMLLFSFAVICVTAEPTEGPEATTPAVENTAETDPTQEVPVETTAIPEETAQTDPPTQEVPASATPTLAPTPTQQATPTPTNTNPPATTIVPTTAGPTTGGVAPGTTVPLISQTPIVGTPTATVLPTLVPTLTPTPTMTPMDTTPPFTMGPINTDELLPQYSPQITPGKTTEPTAPTAPTETTVPTVPAEPTVDMHGYVIRVAATWDEYQDALLNTEAIAAFEAKYNCKVLFLDLSEDVLYNRLLMSKATGVTYFDAILVEGTEILVNLQPLGLLQSFSQYMTEAELAALPVSYQKFLSKDGTLYGIPAKAPDVSGIWYNSAMISQYKYTNSLHFYQAGDWSWNQMISLFKEATRDVDNDGFYDTYGLTSSSPWYLSVLESAGGSMFRWDGSRFLPGATNAVSVQGLSFVRNIYLNHYVASDYERYFYTSQSPYLAGELSMYPEMKSYLKGDLIFLPYPSVSGKAPYTALATSVPSAAITATAIYPEQTAELLKILYGGEALNQRIAAYCTENGFTSQIQTTYLRMLENFTVDYTTAFDATGTIRLKMLSLLKNQPVSAETLQENIQPLLEAAIAEKSTQVNLEEVPVEIRW